MTCFNYSQKIIVRGWQGKLLNLKAGGNATLHQNFNIRRIVVVLLAQFSGMPGAHWASFRFYPLVYPCSRLHRRTYSNSDLVTLASIGIERSSHVRHVMHYILGSAVARAHLRLPNPSDSGTATQYKTEPKKRNAKSSVEKNGFSVNQSKCFRSAKLWPKPKSWLQNMKISSPRLDDIPWFWQIFQDFLTP